MLFDIFIQLIQEIGFDVKYHDKMLAVTKNTCKQREVPVVMLCRRMHDKEPNYLNNAGEEQKFLLFTLNTICHICMLHASSILL